MDVHDIARRSISDAVYIRNNPASDPFKVVKPAAPEEMFLYGLGMGLFWGEGNKANKYSIRLGNTDAQLIKAFIKFLTELYGIENDKLKFSLQLFTDIDTKEAMKFWTTQLGVSETQFYKPTVTISGSIGTYRKKSKYGVLTVYFHNKKLRDILLRHLAAIAQLVERSNGNAEVGSSNLPRGSIIE